MRSALKRLGCLGLLALLFTGTACATPARPGEKILFIGSSTIGHWTTLATDFPQYRTINEGLNGSTYQYIIDSAPGFIRRDHPDRVVMYSGDNDLGNGAKPAQVAKDFEKSVEIIRAASPKIIIDVISVKPSPGRRQLLKEMIATNVLLRASAQHLNVRYIDLFSVMMRPNGEIRRELFDENDQSLLHMNAEGYKVWASAMRAELAR